jgi:hypothetical protein
MSDENTIFFYYSVKIVNSILALAFFEKLTMLILINL